MENHFNTIVLGTGLVESILAAALSKAGYSLLQLDKSPHYGDEWASLSLAELITWSQIPSTSNCSIPSEDLLKIGQRFSLSLYPTLLKATGPGIEVLIRSKVAAYLQFGILNGIGLWEDGTGREEGASQARIERVPASKSDVFNHPTLSLIEKRRLTKLLLFAVGEDQLDQHPLILSDSTITFPNFISTAFSLSSSVSKSLSYALTLCTGSDDSALPALLRLRSFLRSIGRFSPSPFLVGHYGGAGDLVGGFSRICAVWGGGQILGRPILPLKFDSPASPIDLGNQIVLSESTPLSVEVVLDGPESSPTTFTGDWIVSAHSHLQILFPAASFTPAKPSSVFAIVILTSAIPFPLSFDSIEQDPSDIPDSNLFIFEPKALMNELGTVTALQVGPGTFSCPEGYFVLYLQAPILEPAINDESSETLLRPYLTSLLALSPTPLEPSFTLFHSTSPPDPAPIVPQNFLVVPPIESRHRAEGLVMSSDEAAIEAERLFWIVVGEKGRLEGVEFFPREVVDVTNDE